jgi:hypothetical protein
MHISKEDLDWAASEKLISADQASLLWTRLEARYSNRSNFGVANVAYYLGALVVMSALGWFMTLGWQKFGGGGIFLIATGYAIAFLLAGYYLWFSQNLKIPGGLLFTLAVWMVPLAIYGLEQLTGIWPQSDPGTFRDYHIWIKGSWVLMEVGTILAGLIALKFIRFPFLTFPIAFSLWYMSMDLTPLLLRRNEFTWNERLWVSLIFGAFILLVSYVVDRRTREDYAFWGYLFGLMAFWGGLSLMQSNSELNKFLYCLINVGLMLAAIFLDRRAFLVFGGLGVFVYLGHLSYEVFKDSMMFPFALSVLGLLIIFLGIKYQRNREAIEAAILNSLPDSLKNLRPAAR